MQLQSDFCILHNFYWPPKNLLLFVSFQSFMLDKWPILGIFRSLWYIYFVLDGKLTIFDPIVTLLSRIFSFFPLFLIKLKAKSPRKWKSALLEISQLQIVYSKSCLSCRGLVAQVLRESTLHSVMRSSCVRGSTRQVRTLTLTTQSSIYFFPFFLFSRPLYMRWMWGCH